MIYIILSKGLNLGLLLVTEYFYHRYKTIDGTCHNNLPFRDGTIWQPSYQGPVLNLL